MNYDIVPLKKDRSYEKIISSKFLWTNLSQLHIDDFCGWTIDYETYFILMNMLDNIKPKSILELGFGFSSLLIGQYAKFFNAVHDICENDSKWVKYFLEKYKISQSFNIILKDISYTKIQNFEHCRIYDKFTDKLCHKYDFIFIDGPHGCEGISRANIYQHIELLAKNAVIVIHDTNRLGEKTLIDVLKQKLSKYTVTNFNKCSVLNPNSLIIQFFQT